jgi:hypothetical protein
LCNPRNWDESEAILPRSKETVHFCEQFEGVAK